MNYAFFTSESVASGHPDKICDQISDAILDAALRKDPFSRVAVEALVTANHITLAGEITTKAIIDYEKLCRKLIAKLGYTKKQYGFHHHSPVQIRIHQQSADIAQGVDDGGAGDQGLMFGYATDETPELMPTPIVLAHRLVEKIDGLRRKKMLPFIRPDGKSQVKVRYHQGKPVRVEQVVLAVPHDQRFSLATVKNELYQTVVLPVLKKYGYTVDPDRLIVNGTGKWAIGGPVADTGVTGRKIMVDTYGGMARHGGGCFSGKDPTKVDRSAAYAARFIAKNIVAKGLAHRCEVHLAYVIGRKEPVSKAIDTFGTAEVASEKIEKFAWNLLDLSVNGIIKAFNLRRPIYQATACYGHFGRDGFPWEEVVN